MVSKANSKTYTQGNLPPLEFEGGKEAGIIGNWILHAFRISEASIGILQRSFLKFFLGLLFYIRVSTRKVFLHFMSTFYLERI